MSLSKNPFVEFLKATLAGGVLFLLPVVLVLIVLHRAMSYALGAAKPISHLLPVERVIGAYGENALAIFMLILVSLLAGLVARTREGRRIMRWSERSLLGGLPQYQLVKTMAEGLAHVENAKKSSTGTHQHRGRLADRILARAVRKRLGHRISAAGTYSHVRQRDVPPCESDAAIRHHDDSGRGDRETHRRRIRQSSAGHRSHASSGHIEIE